MSDPRPEYEVVIGLEVHVQLRTESKLFSPAPVSTGEAPNHCVHPICLALPGVLPVLNRRAVELAIRTALATHCVVHTRSVFARKNYFYPDLPKGYQISQYEEPIATGGWIEIRVEDGAGDNTTRRIGLTRIHMEEDAGKSIHDQDPTDTLLDYNRCGVPLIEIVSEPELRSAREAYLYMQKIRQLVRYLGICDGNMEEGSLRCDANVSVRPRGQEALGVKTEIKNMNSFRNVERAIDYEIKRQIRLLRRGDEVVHQTLLWDANEQVTRPMRSKEMAHDYRYFPDPDLAQVVVTRERLEEIRAALPELPDVRQTRFVETLKLPAYDAALLTEERGVADYFEATLAALQKRTGASDPAQAKAVSNFVMTEVLRVLNERAIDVEAFPIDADRLAGLVHLRMENKVSSSGAQEIFNAMLDDAREAETLAVAHNLLQVSDAGALLPVVEQVLEKHAGQVRVYLDGKQGLIGFFIGQVMRSFEGSPDPKLVRELLLQRLERRQGDRVRGREGEREKG